MKNVVFLTNHWAKPSQPSERMVHLANETTLKNTCLRTKVLGSDAIRFERLDDEAEPSEEKALSIIEHIITSPLQADIAVVQQYQDAHGDYKLCQTDLAKTVYKQYNKMAKSIERVTGQPATSTRRAQEGFMNTSDEDMRCFTFAVEAGVRLFNPYGAEKFGAVAGACAGAFGEALIRYASNFEGQRPGSRGALRREQKQIWRDVERSAKRCGDAGANLPYMPRCVGGIAGVVVGAGTGMVSGFGTGVRVLAKTWGTTSEDESFEVQNV